MDNLYHLQNYHLLMKNLVLVICFVRDENSENSFFTPDNENRNVIWFLWRKFPSCLTLSLCEFGCVTHHVHSIRIQSHGAGINRT